MKTALKISIAANIGLIALALGLAQRERTGVGGNPAAQVPDASREATAAVFPAAAATASPATPEKFEWSREVESQDYRTYIANLRRIGCPAQTIRDIITADVDSLYAPRRVQFQKEQERQAAVAWAPPSTSGPEPAELLKKLRTEEDAVLTSLLGTNSAPPAGDGPEQGGNAYSFPLAFVEVASATAAELALNQHQVTVMANIRRSFAYEMAKTGYASDSPEYASRWEVLQSSMDRSLRAQVGEPVYRELESLALDGQSAQSH